MHWGSDMMDDSGLFVWASLLGLQDKRRVLRGLELLDEIRIVLGQTAPSNCCDWRYAQEALDGHTRCLVCGRKL